MLSKQAGNSLVILLIILGLIGGGVLIENRFGKHLPTPSPSPVIPQKDDKPTLVLTSDKQVSQLKKDETFTVAVGISDTVPVNLIAAKIHYPKEMVKVVSVDEIESKPIPLWVSKGDVPDESFVELVGGIPTPGLNTNGERVTVIKIVFQLLQDPSAFTILADQVEFYSDKDNKPLENLVILPLSVEQQQVSPSLIPTPTPSATVKKTGSLSLSPSIVQTSPSCMFDLTLNYDSHDTTFLGIDALLTIDPRVLKPVKIVADANKPDTLYAPQLSLTGDTMTIAYLVPQNRDYLKKGSLGKITFKVTAQNAQGMTVIKIKRTGKVDDLSDSNILYSLKEDLLTSSKDTFVLVKPGNCTESSSDSYQILQPNQ